MVAEIGHPIAAVEPVRQLRAVAKPGVVTQLGFMTLQHIESLVSRGIHGRSPANRLPVYEEPPEENSLIRRDG